MGTKQEQTLEIKDFRGVSRYLASPNQPPNKLQTLQNLYSPNRGELAYIPGVTGASMSADGFTNVINDFNFNGQRLIFNKTTVGVLPNPSNANFAITSSGGSSTAYYRLGFVGMGYETDIANSPVFSVSTLNSGVGAPSGAVMTITNGSSIPNTVSAINVYIADVDTLSHYMIVATIYRNNRGSFPATYVFHAGLPAYDTTTPATAQVYKMWDLTFCEFVPKNVTGGTLVPGQTYFFGFAPMVQNTAWSQIGTPIYPTGPANYYYPTVQQAFWQTSNYIAFTLPLGFNAVNIQQMSVSPTWDGVSGHNYNQVYVFCGSSLEDMLLCKWYPGTTSTNVYTDPCPLVQLTSSAGLTVVGTTKAHNNGITMVPGTQQVDSTVNTTRLGMFVPTQQIHTPGAESVACLAFAEGTLDYSVSAASCYQINPCRGYGRYSNDNNQVTYTTPPYPDLFRVYHGGTTPYDRLQGVSFGGSTKRSTRFFMVNNFQVPFYTDGFTFKQISEDYQTVIPPICSNIVVFQNQLVVGGGPTGIQNVQGNIFWSQVDGSGNPNPFAWSAASATPVNNSAALYGDSAGDILGFGIFSYNQAVNSVTTQLVIGMSNSIWMTPSLSSEGPQEVARNVGFAGPNAFINTNIGAFFLGRDNLYQFNTYGIPVAKGQDFLSLIQGMLKSNTAVPPVVYYSLNQIRVAYHVSAVDPNSGAPLYDTEIWCDVQLERIEQLNVDQPRFVWTGPHTLNQVVDSATFPTGVYTDISNITEDYRTGVNSTTAMILQYPGKTSNMGANVSRLIEFNDLYLGVDDFLKLLSRIYIGGKSTQLTNIAISFNMTDQDGAGMGPSGAPTTYSDTMTFNPNNLSTTYMQAQRLFATRYRGRIVSQLTFAWSAGASEETINIYEIALLFFPQNRRRL